MSEEHPGAHANDDHVRGWKEIAAVVRASTRTAQRWEQLMGLPVHRVQGTRGAQAFAARAELGRWMESDLGREARETALPVGERPTGTDVILPGGRRRPWRWVLLAFGLIAVASVAWSTHAALTSHQGSTAGTPANPAITDVEGRPATPVLLRITSGGRPPAVIGVPGGTLGRISLPGRAVTLGVIPRFVADGVAIQLFRIDGTAAGGEPLLTELAKGTLTLGVPNRFDVGPVPVVVEWVMLAAPASPAVDTR